MTAPTNDERVERYAEAMYGTTVQFTEGDPYLELIESAMAVADAELEEQAKTRASGHEGQLIRATRRADELLVRGDQWKDAALAAEDKVAKVEKYAADLEAMGVVNVYESAMEIGQTIRYVLDGRSS